MDSSALQPAPSADSRLVDTNGLLDALFGSNNRPSHRWVQYQMVRRTIPYFRIGRLVRFDPVLVREALNQGCLVCANAGGRKAKNIATTNTANTA